MNYLKCSDTGKYWIDHDESTKCTKGIRKGLYELIRGNLLSMMLSGGKEYAVYKYI